MFKCHFNQRMVRYIVVGVLTTAVNFSVFYALRQCLVPLFIANGIAIVLAILFSYVANAQFVFKTTQKLSINGFFVFFLSRVVTLCLELFGVWYMVNGLMVVEMTAKVAVSGIVLVLNYIFSRFIFLRATDERKL